MFTADSLGVSFRDRKVLKAATVWAKAGQVNSAYVVLPSRDDVCGQSPYRLRSLPDYHNVSHTARGRQPERAVCRVYVVMSSVWTPFAAKHPHSADPPISVQ